MRELLNAGDLSEELGVASLSSSTGVLSSESTRAGNPRVCSVSVAFSGLDETASRTTPPSHPTPHLYPVLQGLFSSYLSSVGFSLATSPPVKLCGVLDARIGVLVVGFLSLLFCARA